jgi:hypothetical protein
MYQAFDSFLNMDTWHTRHPNDERRFFVALHTVVGNQEFNPDNLGDYMRVKKGVSRDAQENAFNYAIRHYVAAAWAVKDYLKATERL